MTGGGSSIRYTRRLTVLVAVVFAVAAMLVLVPSALAATTGIWLTPGEVQGLPMSGVAWERVKRTADADLSGLELVSDGASLHDTATLAVALVAVRLGDASYRRKAAQEIERAIGSEEGPQPPGAGNRHNPAGRNTTAYVIAADLIDLRGYDPALDGRFRAWITRLRDVTTGGGELSFRQIHEERSNNHGTMAGAARAAVSAYLGDGQDLARTAQVLKGWMGDRSSYAWPLSSFHEGSATFMPDPSQPRPVNPVGSVVGGRDMNGAQPQELARCGVFEWPPCHTIYPWGGLAGAVVAAEILRRQGYADVFEWENRAILRAYQWLDTMARGVDRWWWSEAITGDDSWQPWLANFIYATSFPGVSPSRPGRNMGWTDWTHGTRSGAAPPPPPPPPPGPEPPPPPGGTAPSEQPAPLLPDSGDTTPPDGEVRPGLGRRDNTAPRVSVRIRGRQSLRPAARGLIARVHCSERCSVRVRVLLDAGTARSTGLSSSRRWVRLGSKHFLIRRAGGRRVVVRFAPRARAKLRRAQRATLRLHVSVSDRAGNSRLVSRRVALRR